MLRKRIIPCLDVRDGRVVKGVRFRDHKDMGDIIALAEHYRARGADELVFYDITASTGNRVVSRRWVNTVARRLDIPFAVAGGIRTVADAGEILNAGADKVSINSPALETPQLITDMEQTFGSQCVVLGIDSRRDDDGRYRVHQYTGDELRSQNTGRQTIEWAKEGVDRGCGEIVLNCMNRDGTREGYDLEHLLEVRAAVGVPVVASGGAGRREHFARVLEVADAALAAGVFHRGEIDIATLKVWLAEQGLAVRVEHPEQDPPTTGGQR